MFDDQEVTIWELYGKEPVERLELGVSIGSCPLQQVLIDLAVPAFERATATYGVTGTPLGPMSLSGFLLHLHSSTDDIGVNEHVRVTSRPLAVITGASSLGESLPLAQEPPPDGEYPGELVDQRSNE